MSDHDHSPTDEEVLRGGVAHAGTVTRVGEHVLRPSNEFSPQIHEFLTTIRANGFDGAPEPLAIEPDGRERLRFIPGEVPITPFPLWAQSDDALASIARLMAEFHHASHTFDPSGHPWSRELSDPAGGTVIVHNDVCLENIVFRDGRAVALLDFDFAAPGRPTYDLAAFARMCVPVDDGVNAARLGWDGPDKVARLLLVADTYGLTGPERIELIEHLDRAISSEGRFVKRRVDAGDRNFINMWNEIGGAERYRRRAEWWSDERDSFVRALLPPA